MRVILAVVGRPKAGALADAIQEYETRAARYWPLGVVEVREERGSAGVPPDLVKQREGERLLERLTEVPYIVACDVQGISMTSEQFADWMQTRRERAQPMVYLTLCGSKLHYDYRLLRGRSRMS
jgi:23S rRNA (pseudouridine1915-N3)-methyltransferase